MREKRITDLHELQLRLMYCVIVAGKSADFAEKALTALMGYRIENELPFEMLKRLWESKTLRYAIQQAKTGNYKKTEKAFTQMALCEIDLKTAGPEELETIHGARS